MTDRARSRDGTRGRRHPAAASRILATGFSAATVLGLTAGWTATAAPPATDGSANPPVVHAVITDPQIDPDLARRAAAAAAAAGRTTARVTVEPSSDAATTTDTPTRDQTSADSADPDVTTRAS